MAKVSDYPVFDHWYKTCDWILQTCERMPRHTRFTLSGRITNLSLEIVSLLTETIYSAQRLPLLQRINLLLEQLRLLFRLTKDRNYMSIRQYEHISGALFTFGGMIGGWMKMSKP